MEADSQEKREEEGSSDVDHGGVVDRVVLGMCAGAFCAYFGT